MSTEAPWPVFAIRHYDICNDAPHKGNIRIIKEFFDSKKEVSVWAAWGEHINERRYLILCFKEIYSTIKNDKVSCLHDLAALQQVLCTWNSISQPEGNVLTDLLTK